MAHGATRWGIMGTGRICEDFVTALRTLPAGDHVVAAVGGRSKAKSEEFASKHGIGLALGSEELVKLDTLDVVYVGTLNHVHKDSVLLALRAGRNVVCEKVMGINHKEVSEMVAEARKHNAFLMEAYWSKFFPVYERMAKIIGDGEIGEPRMVSAQFGFTMGEQVMDPETGGGTLLSIGCYTLLLARTIFKGEDPTRITTSAVIGTKTGVDESLSVTLEYSGNRTAQLFSIGTATLPINNAIVVGSKGCLQLPDHFWCPTRLINPRGVTEEFPLPASEKPFHFPNSAGLRYEAEAVRQCLLKGLKESPGMPLADSLFLAKLCDEIRAKIGVRYKQDV